jgi:hypothetical protein
MYSFAAGPPNVFAEILDELKKLNSIQIIMQQQIAGVHRDMSLMKTVMAVFQKSSDVEVLGSAPHAVDLQPMQTCEARDHQEPVCPVESRWKCQICGKVLANKGSYVGHIRKLVYSSKRPKCHMNPADEQHKTLVNRFPGSMFYERAQAFCKAFYNEVKWSCTKRDDDDQSFEHVTAWFRAALSGVEVDFPVYDPRFRPSARKQRLDADADHSNPISTSQSSLDSIESFNSNCAW